MKNRICILAAIAALSASASPMATEHYVDEATNNVYAAATNAPYLVKSKVANVPTVDVLEFNVCRIGESNRVEWIKPISTWVGQLIDNGLFDIITAANRYTDSKIDEIPSWAKETNPPTETDPTIPSWAKETNPPTETDPTVPAWAKSANPPTETDPTVPAWAKAPQAPVTSLAPATNYTDSVVAPIWQIVLGDRVWFAVTNYMRTVDGIAPSLQLWEVRNGVTNLVYHSTEEITNLIGKATAPLATTQALDAVRTAMPSKAWSRFSTPVVQLTGGGEWTPHTLSSGGTVWTLESNGFTSISGSTNGYFSIRNTVTGEEVFSVEERSILPSVPVNAAFEAKGGGEGFYYTVYADTRPTLYTSTNLTSRAKAAWDAQGEDPNVIVNSWTHNGDGTWTADVTLVVPSVQYFAYVGVQESKDTVISNKRAASFDGGIVIGDAKYRLGTATINGVRVLTAEAIP